LSGFFIEKLGNPLFLSSLSTEINA